VLLAALYLDPQARLRQRLADREGDVVDLAAAFGADRGQAPSIVA
jgi:hypothetical protein